ncbi:MAG: hypothetical protein PSV13_15800 [Lacunisphaera sp.]|nr:hypothetical protein [Lacunisphaera sp.]
MRLKLFVLGCLALVGRVSAGPLDDKSPGYFVDRYGPAKSAQVVSKESFVHTERGAVVVKGQFSVREFRKDKLIVHAVFFEPSLQLAAVRLQMNNQWTAEQIEAALTAYGGEWKPVKQGLGIQFWVAPDGSKAISMLTWLDFQSKAVVDLILKSLAEDDAKRKAVPKF